MFSVNFITVVDNSPRRYIAKVSHTHAEMANHDESKFLRDMTIYRHARPVSRIHSLVCHLSFRGDSGDDGGEDKRKAKEAQVKRSGGRRERGGTRGRGWKGTRKGNGSKDMVVVKNEIRHKAVCCLFPPFFNHEFVCFF